MWKKMLCMAVVGLSLVASAQAQSAVPNIGWVSANVDAVGEGPEGVYVVLSINSVNNIPLPLSGPEIMVADTNRVPHALDIGLTAINSGKPVIAYCQYIEESGIIMSTPLIVALFVTAPNLVP